MYKPSLDYQGKLDVAVAVGVNGCEEKVKILYGLGIRLFVLDTAHGYQQSMIENIKNIRLLYKDTITLVAGNVITEDATRDLILA